MSLRFSVLLLFFFETLAPQKLLALSAKVKEREKTLNLRDDMEEADQAREEALAEYRRKLLSHKEVDAQVS